MDDDVTAMTPEGLRALREEVEHLQTVGRQEIAERIRVAREWGDLKENSEYHDAKNSQSLLERRITLLDKKLRSAVAVEPDKGADVAGFGTTIHVVDEETGRPATYTLVGSAEASAAAGRLSTDSPVARALKGARAGDVVAVPTPRGERRLRVERLGT